MGVPANHQGYRASLANERHMPLPTRLQRGHVTMIPQRYGKAHPVLVVGLIPALKRSLAVRTAGCDDNPAAISIFGDVQAHAGTVIAPTR